MVKNLNKTPSSFPGETQGVEYVLRYAEGFKVVCYPDYTIIEVRDPWNPRRNLQRYVLIDRNKVRPAYLPAGTLILVPIRKMAVTTAVHCAVLEELGVINDVIGICEPRFVINPAIRSRLADGLIADMGESVSPNAEKMIEQGVEVLIASPFQNAGYGSVEKTGIPVIECADYMETTPLGRAEWIRFLGLFTGKSTLADSLFPETETRYLEIKNTLANISHRPTLFTEKRYGSTWYVPSGRSYMAQLYHDAGADYVFSYLPGSGGAPLNFETVLDKAIHAGFWLFNYSRSTEMTYQFLESEYTLYSHFDAFKAQRVFGCNTNTSLFYEETPFHPDYLLRELATIFHPELMPGYHFRYFHPLR
ncbi:MAG: ABC transporter substrate-binding protein [Tannerella sp.]|nr:ABC transporter substrate-binding protein [Tannerella sp.]